MMANVHVAVTTIPEREQSLKRLLITLRQQRGVELDIHVHNDGPEEPNVGSAVTTHTTTTRLGKSGYWRLVNQTFRMAQKKSHAWDYVLFVQDDVRWEDPTLLAHALEHLIYLQEEIVNVATLNLYGDGPEWNDVARWTARPAVELWNGMIYASWVDMACVLFTPIAFEVVPVLDPPQMEDSQATSSGVGRQLSLRYDLRRCAQIMTPEPWVDHADNGVSYMNPEEVPNRNA